MPTIIPTTAEESKDIARRLLEAADSPDDVVTDTSGPRLGFRVSDELAAAAGFDVTDDNVVDQDEPDEKPADSPDGDGKTEVKEPPRGGKGSGGDVWLAFLTEQGVTIPDGLTADDRDDLVAVWDEHLDAQQ